MKLEEGNMRLLKGILAFLIVVFLLKEAAFAGNDLTYNRKVFPSGFALIIHEDFSHPVVSARLVVRTGSIYEDLRTNGIAHFYEHIFFKGTPRRNAFQMKSEIEAIGGEMNGTTYKDFTEFYINVPSSFSKETIDLLMDAALNASLSSEEIERERKVVLEEISLNRQNPQRMIMELLYENLYLEHPYRIPVGGTAQSVSRITREDIKDFKARYYNLANAALIVVGAVDAKSIESQVSDIIEKIPARPLDLPSLAKETPHTKTRLHIQKEEVERAYLGLGYLVSGLDTPLDIYPIDLLTFILGQGKGSRLDRIIKHDKHLVKEIGANYETVRFPGMLEVTAILEQENSEAAKKAILEEILLLKQGKITNEELERAKRLLEGTYTMGHETMSGKSGTLAHYEGHGHIDFVKDYLDRISKVTISDIVRVANKYLNENYTEVWVLPKSKKEEKK